MKSLLSLLFLAQGARFVAAGVCNADNCARAVTGTAHGTIFQATAKLWCSSFLQATVYPATVTSTVSTTIFRSTNTEISTGATVTQTSTVYPFTATYFSTTTTDLEVTTASTVYDTESTQTVFATIRTITVLPKKRAVASAETVYPSSIATYFSACSGSVRYSSACSCFGVTPTTITMSTPTSTITQTVTGTDTVTSYVTSTSIATLSGTTTITSFVDFITVSSVIETIPVTTTTTQSVEATITPTATANALCENGKFVDGLSSPCEVGPCQSFNLRIEAASDTVYEGPIYTGPQNVSTPSGGTHLCNGQNNGVNPSPGGTATTGIQSAAGLCGFGFDGTYDSAFQDFFITTIGSSAETSTEFWGLLNNYQFTPSGGCQTEPAAGDEILWAFNAFNSVNFLVVTPRTATVSVGSTIIFTVTDGTSGVTVQGAAFDGLVSNSNGQIVFTAIETGSFRYKATRSDSIRSPAVVITVTN